MLLIKIGRIFFRKVLLYAKFSKEFSFKNSKLELVLQTNEWRPFIGFLLICFLNFLYEIIFDEHFEQDLGKIILLCNLFFVDLLLLISFFTAKKIKMKFKKRIE